MNCKVLSFLSMGLIFAFNSNNQNSGYIKLLYASEEGKPYPEIIFYLPGSLDSTNLISYSSKFVITEDAFEMIRRSTEDRKSVPNDTVLLNTFQFVIVHNEETTIFLTKNIRRIRQIFQVIIQQVKDVNQQSSVKWQLDYFIDRLKYNIKEN